MSVLAVFGSESDDNIQEFLSVGADCYFVVLRGEFVTKLEMVRRLHKKFAGRIGVAQFEYVDGPSLDQLLPSDWPTPCAVGQSEVVLIFQTPNHNVPSMGKEVEVVLIFQTPNHNVPSMGKEVQGGKENQKLHTVLGVVQDGRSSTCGRARFNCGSGFA
jgi:hypothetical protein